MEDLHHQIDIADIAGRNKIFLWYINDISTKFTEFAAEESKCPEHLFGDKGYSKCPKIPINTLLRDMFLEFKVCNEADTYIWDHWKWTLEWFEGHLSQIGQINSEGRKIYPGCKEHDEAKYRNGLSLKEVIEILK